jgi:hypothetical protein
MTLFILWSVVAAITAVVLWPRFEDVLTSAEPDAMVGALAWLLAVILWPVFWLTYVVVRKWRM